MAQRRERPDPVSGTRSPSSAEEISAEGRLAGRTVAILLVATGAGSVAASWDDLWRACGEIAGPCVSRSASAVMLSAVSLGIAALGVLLWIRIGRRPIDAEGSSRSVWALGLLVALGAAFAASRIPSFTCARGRFDDLLELCMHPPSTSEPARWLLAKQALVVAGIVGGLVVAVRPRWVRMSAPLAALLWLGGAGWLVFETMVRPPG